MWCLPSTVCSKTAYWPIQKTFPLTCKTWGDTSRKSRQKLEQFAKLERYIIDHIPDDALRISYKQLNDNAVHDGIETANEKQIKTLLYFLVVKGYARKKEDGARNMIVTRQGDIDSIIQRFVRRIEVCRLVIDWLYLLVERNEKERNTAEQSRKDGAVQFSVVELLKEIKSSNQNAPNKEYKYGTRNDFIP